jgi:ABC-type cobalamin transport system ATPase subunit
MATMNPTPPVARLYAIDGAAGELEQDEEAYRVLAETCEQLLATLTLSDDCAGTLRRAARASWDLADERPLRSA